MQHTPLLMTLTVLLTAGLATAAEDGHKHSRGASAPAGHATALGRPGDPKQVSCTVQIAMRDNLRFDPNQASVEAGQTGQLVWQFTKAGSFDFACLQAGHHEAGMKGQVVVGSPAAPVKTVKPVAFGSGDTVVAQAAGPAMSDGEVRKVDKEGGKLTLKHGEIKNLDMPGMTMVFVVKDKALLDTLKPGDKVKFTAVNEGGKLTVTAVEVQK